MKGQTPPEQRPVSPTEADTEQDGGPFAQPLMPGTMVGEYRVERKIGEGGMGTVYGAIHPVIGKKAAIKLLRAELSVSPEAVERFLGEARAVNQIGHPNIVDVFSFGALPDGRRYFAMEWLAGESLASRIDRDGGLPLAEALPILDQVCAALAAAHERGIVHRDLKPDNVFLVAVRGEAPRVKLLDFGIAKLVGEPLGIKRTKTGALMGTPGYIAPEQARGEEVDARADIYALGCMAFELITGRLPFLSESAMVVITKHLTEDPPAPSSVDGCSDLPTEVDGLLLSMLAKQRSMRPDLDDIRARLASFARALGPTATRAPRRAKGVSRAPTATPPPEASPTTGVIVAAVPVSPAVTTPLGTPAPVATTVPPRTASAMMTVPLGTRSGDDLAIDDEPAPPRSRLPWVLAAVAAVVAVVVVAVVMAGGRSRPSAPAPSAAVTRPGPPSPGPQPAPPDPAPPPTAPPPVATGTLALTVTGGAGATVTIDGQVQPGEPRGKVLVPLTPGSHEVVITARRMKTERRTVTVVAATVTDLTVALTPERRRGGNSSGGASAGGDDDALIEPTFGKKPSGGSR